MFAPNTADKHKRKREPRIEEILPHSPGECQYRLESLRRPGLESEFYRGEDDELGFRMVYTDYGLLPVNRHRAGTSLTYVRVCLSGTIRRINADNTLIVAASYTDPRTFVVNSIVMTLLGAPLLMFALRSLRMPTLAAGALVILAGVLYLTLVHPQRMADLHAEAMAQDVRDQLGL